MDKLLLHIDSVNLDFYIVDGGSKQDVIDYISEVFDNVPLNSVKTKLYCCDGGYLEIHSFRLETDDEFESRVAKDEKFNILKKEQRRKHWEELNKEFGNED